MVDGYGSDGSPGLVTQALQSVDLPFDLVESYITSLPVKEALAVVRVSRSLIQGWSEVAELADLPLQPLVELPILQPLVIGMRPPHN